MLGILRPQGSGALRLEHKRIAHMGVLCAYVTTGGGWERRRLARGVRCLRREGVRYILPCRDWRPDIPLPVAEGLPLCRAVAHRLVVGRLSQRGISPQRATVVLRGDYPDADLTAAAYRLCPLVRQVVIATRRNGEELQRRLYKEFGVTVGPVTTEAETVQVCFSGQPMGADVVLCEEGDVAGIRMDLPRLDLPDWLEPIPFLCVLWQDGRLNLDELSVCGK